jgi:hypothetical protein
MLTAPEAIEQLPGAQMWQRGSQCVRIPRSSLSARLASPDRPLRRDALLSRDDASL